MASKSKRRRRVFRASCILAALIIAGSSFAWFTSQDEVTNRLSASGDYDVSIVESFAPPAKWVPGQAVNKDVYAVNTGNVEAFVKESVTSVMTIVTEDAYKTDDDKPDADSIELTPAERYVVEAGAFLAYAPAASGYTYQTTDIGKVIDGVTVTAEDVGKVKSGMKAVAMSPEPRQTEYDYEATSATDFTPDAEGLYVFRRTIGVDPNTQLENYTYDAYYYVPGTGTAAKEVQKTKNGVQVYGKDGSPDIATDDISTLPDGYAAKGTVKKDDVPMYTNGTTTIATDAEPPAGYTPVYDKVQATDENDPTKLAWVNKDDPTDVQYADSNPNDTKYVELWEESTGVDGSFYKVSNLAVKPEKATFAGDADQRDGMVDPAFNEDTNGDPAHNYGFYKDVTKTIVPKLTYDKSNNRLVASYDTGMSINKGDLDALAEEYEDAAIAYQDALEEYAAAVGDLEGRTPPGGTSKTLKDESDTLRDELAKLLAAKQTEAAAKKKYEDGVKEAERLEAIMNAAAEEKNGAAANLGTEHVDPEDDGSALAVYTPAVGDTPAQNDTLWGRYNAAKLALGETTDVYNASATPATGDTAYGHENAAKNYLGDPNDDENTDTAYGRYKKAKDELDAAEPSARNAFLDLVATYINSTKTDVGERRADAEAYLADVSYEDLLAANIANPADGEYNYYRLVVAEKYAAEDLQRAKDAYNEAVRNRVAAQNALATALANRQAAETALGDADSTDETTAAGRYNKAKQKYEAQMEDVYGYPNGGTTGGEGTSAYDAEHPDASENKYKSGSFYADYLDAQDATAAQQAAVDTQQSVYNEALAAVEADTADVEAAANHLAETRQAMENAKAAYDTAYAADKGELKININLADVVTEGGVADKWQILPESLEDKYVNATTLAGTDGTTDTASFYYTSILGGGETSSKLIDSVELDSSVTKEMFKYFDFDLNITLNSAQVNIDENGNYTAETAQSELGKYALLADNTSADTAITWSDTVTTAPAKYNATAKTSTDTGGTYGDAGDVTIKKLDNAVLVNGTYCLYEAKSGSDYYYGNSLNKDAVYTYATVNDGVYTADTEKLLKLEADATVDNT